jgi:hypothetical protein
MDLGVVPVAKEEGEAERRFLGIQPCAEENAQGRRVDELGVAKIDHDPLALVQQGVELVLESIGCVRVVLPDERDDGSRGVPPS